MKTLIVTLPQFEEALKHKIGEYFTLGQFFVKGPSGDEVIKNFGFCVGDMICVEYEHKREVFAQITQIHWDRIPESDNWAFKLGLYRIEEPKVSALELIKQERQRQINKHGYTLEHDDRHTQGELSNAAICYLISDPTRGYYALHDGMDNFLDYFWPWSDNEYNPAGFKPTPDDRIRELIKAGALIVAEIERLQRLEQKNE
jgi:hypothetical protein